VTPTAEGAPALSRERERRRCILVAPVARIAPPRIVMAAEIRHPPQVRRVSG